MLDNEIINNLATQALKDKNSFRELFLAVEPQFNGIVDNYFLKNNLTNFNFERADYLSALNYAVWESLEDYDSSRGNFMPRLITFAINRMRDITDYNLASRRYCKDKKLISYEQIFGSKEYDLQNYDDDFKETEQLIYDFIKKDAEGEVINILISTNSSKLRRVALIELYGQYTDKERKRVQRVRERLKQHLLDNGVYIHQHKN